MSRHHVGEESEHQGEWLGEDAHEFYQRHDGHWYFEPPGGVRPEYVFPVSLGPEEIDGQEGAHRQHHRDSDIACHTGPAGEYRYQPHQVVYKDEEERGKQVRGELAVVWAYAGLDDVVVHHHDKHLHEAHKAAGDGFLPVMAAVPSGHAQYDSHQQEAVEHQGEGDFGDGDVQRADLAAGFVVHHQFAFIWAAGRGDGQALLGAAVHVQA